MNLRVSISKKKRFEVFKRDSFTCQYCGRKAPEIVLHCDHIMPVSKGGKNDILNLITSCFDCNSGKGARELTDSAAVTKQIDQLALLQERRAQIEMMIEWREGLSDLDGDIIDRLIESWAKIIEQPKVELTPFGRDKLRKVLLRFGADLTIRAMQESAISYLRRDGEQKYTKESLDKAFTAIGAVAGVLKQSDTRPFLRQMYYARGILRNRLGYVNENIVMSLMDSAINAGADVEDIISISKSVRSWTQFQDQMIQLSENGGEDGEN